MNSRIASLLISGGAISAALLILFMGLKASHPSVMELQAQWMALSLVPLAITLLLSGLISKFSGFGIEISSALNEPAKKYEDVLLRGSSGREIVPDQFAMKRRIDEIPPDIELGGQPIRVLRIVASRSSSRFSVEALREYLRALEGADFIEVVTEDRRQTELGRARGLRLLGLFRVSEMYHRGSRDLLIMEDGKSRFMDEFVDALNNFSIQRLNDMKIKSRFFDHSISLGEIASEVSRSGVEIFALTDEHGNYLGVATASNLVGLLLSKLKGEVAQTSNSSTNRAFS